VKRILRVNACSYKLYNSPFLAHPLRVPVVLEADSLQGLSGILSTAYAVTLN